LPCLASPCLVALALHCLPILPNLPYITLPCQPDLTLPYLTSLYVTLPYLGRLLLFLLLLSIIRPLRQLAFSFPPSRLRLCATTTYHHRRSYRRRVSRHIVSCRCSCRCPLRLSDERGNRNKGSDRIHHTRYHHLFPPTPPFFRHLGATPSIGLIDASRD
jgi:hypothetical protein